MELVYDSTGTSMQVAAVLMLEIRLLSISPPCGRRSRIASRRCPGSGSDWRRPPFGHGRPVWIDDASFTIADPAGSVACPAPGNEQALLDVVADSLTTRLPASRPLWSATLVTGIADDRSALVVVFHHVLTDGIGGLAVLTHLVDGAPAVPRQEFPRTAPRHRDPLIDVWRSRARAVRRLPAVAGRLRAAVAEVSGISGNVTVAFVALSYAGTLNITAIADPNRCRDFGRLAEALQRELRVLTNTVSPGQAGDRPGQTVSRPGYSA